MNDIRKIIEEAFENRAEITPRKVDTIVKEAVEEAVRMLDTGKARVAEKNAEGWIVNEWLKKAVLLSFRIEDNAFMKGGFTNYFDKVPPKFADYNSRDFRNSGVRVVPPATVRRGAYLAPNVVLMPSYVNIGAYVDSGTMVDTWATVGSCAQIGKDVHLSGGVGIGGVLEPLQAGTHHHRGQLLHRRPLGDRRGRDRRGRLGDLDGRVHRPEHQDLQPRDRRSDLRPHPRRLGRGLRQPALEGRQLQPVLRGDRQAGGREDPLQGRHQRAAAQRAVSPSAEPMLTLYGIANCDTVKKARRWLDTRGLAYIFVDLRRDGLDPGRLQGWIEALGWEALLNRRGTTWRRLPEAERAELTAARARTLMLEHPTLVKRPVLEDGGAVQVGFSDAQFTARFG